MFFLLGTPWTWWQQWSHWPHGTCCKCPYKLTWITFLYQMNPLQYDFSIVKQFETGDSSLLVEIGWFWWEGRAGTCWSSWLPGLFVTCFYIKQKSGTILTGTCQNRSNLNRASFCSYTCAPNVELWCLDSSVYKVAFVFFNKTGFSSTFLFTPSAVLLILLGSAWTCWTCWWGWQTWRESKQINTSSISGELECSASNPLCVSVGCPRRAGSFWTRWWQGELTCSSLGFADHMEAHEPVFDVMHVNNEHIHVRGAFRENVVTLAFLELLDLRDKWDLVDLLEPLDLMVAR